MEVDQIFSNKVFPMQVENTVSLVSCGEMNESAAVKKEPSEGELNYVSLEDSKCYEVNIVDEQGTLMPEVIKKENDINFQLIECSPANSNTCEGTDMNGEESEVIPIANSLRKSETKAQLIENSSDGSSDTIQRFSCEICGQKFKKLALVKIHIKRFHYTEGDLRDIPIDFMSHENQSEGTQAEQMTLKMEITVEETTLLQPDDFGISTLNPSTDFPEFSQYSKDKIEEYSEPSSVNFSGQKSASTQERNSDVLEKIDSISSDQDIVCSRLSEHSSANSNILDETDNDMTEMESVVMAQGKHLQLFVENQLNGISEAKCSHCGKKFSGVIYLARHIELCHQSYPCNICGITLASYGAAQYHKMMAHTEPNHNCPHCSKKFHKKNEYCRHLPVCVGRKIPCELCGLKFKSLHSANIHKKRTHPVDKGLSNVQIDQKGCSQEQATNNSVQSLGDCSRRSEDTEPIAETPSSASSDTKCSHCGKVFTSVKSLSYHIGTCHKPTTCNICGKLFPGKNSAKHHKKTKHTEPKYKCPNCPLKIYRKGQYQAHLASCGERRLPCQLCAQMLKNVSSLKIHLRRVHHIEGDLSKFQVTSVSGKKQQKQKHFEQIALKEKFTPLLHNHHGQSTPNQLTIADCPDLSQLAVIQEPSSDKSIYSSSETRTMSQHSLQPICGSIDTKCAQCGKECSSLFALARHMQTMHVPHPCDVCGITFSSYGQAYYHKMMKHMKPKHKCPHCPKIFHSKKDYQTHLHFCRRRKFSCELCDQKFKASAYVIRHMRNVHKITGALKKVLINSIGSNEQNHTEKIGIKKDISVEGTTSNPFIVVDCPICGDNFGYQSQVSHHVETIHQKTMCTSCGMTFTSADQLNDHKIATCSNVISAQKGQILSKERLQCQHNVAMPSHRLTGRGNKRHADDFDNDDEPFIGFATTTEPPTHTRSELHTTHLRSCKLPDPPKERPETVTRRSTRVNKQRRQEEFVYN